MDGRVRYVSRKIPLVSELNTNPAYSTCRQTHFGSENNNTLDINIITSIVIAGYPGPGKRTLCIR